MAECPRCGGEVDELYFLPPEVVTREVLAAFGGDGEWKDHETCDECLQHLMEM